MEAFLDRFFYLELREAKEEEFMNLKKGKMSFQEYTLKFNQLSYYSPEMTSSMKARMRKFAFGDFEDLLLECQGAMFNSELDFTRLTVHIQQVEEKKKKIAESREKDKQAKRARSADWDSNAESLSLQSVPIVNQFSEVFLDDLPGIPPDREMNFGIDVLPDTRLISIPPYRIAPAELTNTPTTFMDLMNRAFHLFLDLFVIVFIDDILIYSKSDEDHSNYL
ncbi:uncharacterized protein LOC124888892 [Capsicum annuum]|uniref:uncharacterized protein LOC124888892 n=1 Tax=Capsicum annuum TaxID=4072 RepID=UPI001FB0D0EC|nr:uncharacterized protein LOC124888892 [Capsicum annuum]